MTLAEAGEIFAYWEHNPPAHLLLQSIARLLGWAPACGPSPTEAIAATPPLGLAVAHSGELGMPAPLDEDTLRTRNRERTLAIARRNLPFDKR